MAKAKRVPLNRLVKPETFDTVKNLAEVLECSEGEVVDKAVEFFEVHSGGEAQVVTSYPVPKVQGHGLADLEEAVPVTPLRSRPESGFERAARERRERQERARNLDSVDDESFDRSDEFVSG